MSNNKQNVMQKMAKTVLSDLNQIILRPSSYLDKGRNSIPKGATNIAQTSMQQLNESIRIS